jgi:hypothetical protein
LVVTAVSPGCQHPILHVYKITGSQDNLRVELVFSLLPKEVADLKRGEQGARLVDSAGVRRHPAVPLGGH